MTTRIAFAGLCATQGDFPNTEEWQKALTAIAVGEGSQARFNPIDTILWEPGATPYNSFGPGSLWHVWNYPDLATGVHATVVTLHGWPNVWADLEDKASALNILAAVDESDGLGINGYYQKFLPQVEATWPQLGNVLIAGSTPDPPPPLQTGEAEMFLVKANGTVGPWYLIGGPPPGKSVLSEGELAAYNALLPAAQIKPDYDGTLLSKIPDIGGTTVTTTEPTPADEPEPTPETPAAEAAEPETPKAPDPGSGSSPAGGVATT